MVTVHHIFLLGEEVMPSYGILHLDYQHCLKCGHASDTITRHRFKFTRSGYQIDGWAMLCKPCLAEVREMKPASVRQIIGIEGVADMRNDNSPYCEVVDGEFYNLFLKPKWLRDRQY